MFAFKLPLHLTARGNHRHLSPSGIRAEKRVRRFGRQRRDTQDNHRAPNEKSLQVHIFEEIERGIESASITRGECRKRCFWRVQEVSEYRRAIKIYSARRGSEVH